MLRAARKRRPAVTERLPMKLSSILRTLLSRAAWAALAVTPLAQAAPVIQHWQTAGGARVYFVESRALPIVDVQVDFSAGSAYDPAEKGGLASLTRGVLDLGAGELDENAIAGRLADLGAQLGGGADLDRASVSLRTLADETKREPALAILRSVLRALDEQLYRPTARPADPEKIEEYLNKKMDANLEKIRDARILKELWNYDRIWINGRSYRNLKELGRLFDHNALRTLFAADPVADIHGDLTVENIICRTDVENPDKAWYIIDPNTGNLHDSPYLDYGKLLQSLHGGYEFMMMTPRCTVQENHIDFQLTRSAAYDTLFEAVCDDLRARCGAAGLHSILAHELIHWLRLMPYKLNKDKKRAPMFYAGLVMVANDLNTWENEGKFDEKARTDRR